MKSRKKDGTGIDHLMHRLLCFMTVNDYFLSEI